MTIRNLKYMFNPSSIAIIGKGNKPNAPDNILIRNLISGSIKGPIMPVNPDRRALEGVLTYKDVASLPLPPELAIITTPLDTAPALISELGALGTRAVVLLSDAVLKHREDKGAGLRQAMLNAAKPYLLRILGPDSLGMAAPHTGVHAILSETPVCPGQIAMLSQSSAVTRSVMDYAANRNLGFSHVLSVGTRIDVDFGDLIDYFAQDNRARAILIYLEHVRNARKFMSAARVAARMKPVLVLRPRSCDANPLGDEIYDAAFRRAGILRVSSIEGFFRSVESLDTLKQIYNNRLAILGNSRSIAFLATDDLIRGSNRGRLAEFSEEIRQELAKIVPKGFSFENPMDMGDRADPKAYGETLALLLKERNIDGILVLHAAVTPEYDLQIAQTVVEHAAKTRRLVMTCWLGGSGAEAARQLFYQHSIATFANLNDAVLIFKRIAEYTRNKELLMETPPSVPEEFETDTKTARQVITSALAAGRNKLNPFETADVLAAYGIPAVETRFAETPEAAATIVAEMDQAVALKIYSREIASKSSVAGVAFNLESPDEVRDTARTMLRRVRRLAPEAAIDGFLVQPMLTRGSAYELAIGVRTGRRFGPVIFFGHGGTEIEAINDLACALPPLNMHLAQELMSRTRIYSMLSNTLGRRADTDALALTLIKVSQMVIDLGEVVELTINPLWADADGTIVLDAHIQIAEFTLDAPTKRLAIRPYPKELEQDITLPDGRTLHLRPIMAEDEPAMQAMVRRADPEDLRLRFFQPIRELTHAMAARLTQLDYDREMAFAITGPGKPGEADIFGVVRINADPDLEKGEYAIILDRTVMGLGLGPMLMRHIIEYARKQGIQEIFGEVLRENKPMLKLNRALGFTVVTDPDDPAMMRVSLKP